MLTAGDRPHFQQHAMSIKVVDRYEKRMPTCRPPCKVSACDKFCVPTSVCAVWQRQTRYCQRVAYERASANGQSEELLKHAKDYESPERVSKDQLF